MADNWICPECKAYNHIRRTACWQCASPRPGLEVDPPEGSAAYLLGMRIAVILLLLVVICIVVAAVGSLVSTVIRSLLPAWQPGAAALASPTFPL